MFSFDSRALVLFGVKEKSCAEERGTFNSILQRPTGK